MAVLNFTFSCCSKPASLPLLQFPISSSQTQVKISDNSSISLGDSLSKACVTAALVSTSLFLAIDPTLAYKGGGPYSSEVTRGQDLTVKDFSGKTLIKQDFKTDPFDFLDIFGEDVGHVVHQQLFDVNVEDPFDFETLFEFVIPADLEDDADNVVSTGSIKRKKSNEIKVLNRHRVYNLIDEVTDEDEAVNED